MLTAREIDLRERLLVSQGLGHFHVNGAGHEAMAALAAHLTYQDWLHLHYRDKALLLARGLPVTEFFRSLVGHPESHSAGRQMSAHFSAPDLRVLSIVGPVGNNALQAVGIAAAICSPDAHVRTVLFDRTWASGLLPDQPIVICSVGDGTTQEGEFLEAVAEAVRRHLPILFLVEDNRFSISTRTRGQTFFDLPQGPATELFGIPIQFVDGADVVAMDDSFARVVAQVRQTRAPALVVVRVERLSDHTNADDESGYRDLHDICTSRRPLIQFVCWKTVCCATACPTKCCVRFAKRSWPKSTRPRSASWRAGRRQPPGWLLITRTLLSNDKSAGTR